MAKKINRAGVIPYIIQNDKIQMLFMKPSDPTYGGDAFQIAKGKQETGESDAETAFREAGEELGLFPGNIDEKHNLGNFLGRTHVYLARIKDKDMFGDPCEETGGTRWMSPEQFDGAGRPLHRPVVKAAVRMINDKEGLDQANPYD